jgi:hypothetical protein
MFKGFDSFATHLNEECPNIEGKCSTCAKKIKRLEMALHDCVPELLMALNTTTKQNEELLTKL